MYRSVVVLICMWTSHIETNAGTISPKMQFNQQKALKNIHLSQFQNTKIPVSPYINSSPFKRISPYENQLLHYNTFNSPIKMDYVHSLQSNFDPKRRNYPVKINYPLPSPQLFGNEESLYNNQDNVNHITKSSLSYLRRKFQDDESLSILLGLFPAALFLASLIPKYIIIPTKRISSVSDPVKASEKLALNRQRRHVGQNETLNLEDPNCLKKFICQSARQGRKNEGNSIQKTLYQFISKIYTKTSPFLNLKTLFEAIKGNKCYMFQCRKNKKKKFERYDTEMKFQNDPAKV